jgi:hypothetical protein
MLPTLQYVETGSAVILRVSPELIVCRYKPGAKVDRASAQGNLQARMSLPGEVPHAVITIFPQGTEFGTSLLDLDQYATNEVAQRTRLLAFVAEDPSMDAMINLYFAHHPTTVTKRVFASEAEAMDWVLGQLEPIG